jgi:DNA-binding MarR family transcriptional regulator
MVDRGLVTKKANPDDARSWLVSLTAAGERAVAALNRALDDHARGLLESLSKSDRAAVEKSLLLMLRALRENAAAKSEDTKAACR